MDIVQAVKKLNSILRERLNFRRRPILCTTLYRNLMQASNFGGTFDQLFLRIFFYKIFPEDASLCFLYHGAKKSKMTKNSNQGGGGVNNVQCSMFVGNKNISMGSHGKLNCWEVFKEILNLFTCDCVCSVAFVKSGLLWRLSAATHGQQQRMCT